MEDVGRKNEGMVDSHHENGEEHNRMVNGMTRLRERAGFIEVGGLTSRMGSAVSLGIKETKLHEANAYQ